MKQVPAEQQPSAWLAPELLPYITDDKLASNLGNYPEMEVKCNSDRLEAIKQHLLTVPLVHTFNDMYRVKSMRESGLQPYGARIHTMGNTLPVDESLGLSRYTFFHWGQRGAREYGLNHILAPARLMLRNTVVTPMDIARHLEVQHLSKPFEEIGKTLKDRVQAQYFDKMVRGEDWLEILSRRILSHYIKWPDHPWSMYRPMALGEIKHLGPVDGKDLGEVLDTPGNENFDMFMTRKGFVLSEWLGGTQDRTETQPAIDCWRRIMEVS